MPIFLRHGSATQPAKPLLVIDPAWADFLEALPAMTWLADSAGRLVFANHAWSAATGLNPETYNPELATQLIHPDDLRRLDAGAGKGIFSGTSTAFEFRLRHADGNYRWVMERIRPWVGRNGEQMGHIGSAIDIHDQKTHERWLSVIALRQSSLACFGQFILEQSDADAVHGEALRLLCEHLDIPAALLLLSDEPGAAPRFVATRGLSADATPPEIGAPLASASPCDYPDDAKVFPVSPDWLESSGWGWACAIPIDPLEPGRGCFVVLAPEPPGEHPPVHYARELASIYAVADARARAERKHRESLDRALQVQKMEAVGLLAGGIAHDFNNLLTAIRCFAELLHDELDDAPRRARVDDILHASSRASHLVRQLVSFSRQEIVQPEPIDLRSLVDNLRGLIRSLVSEHVTLEFDLGASHAWCQADPKQIEQILFNLCLNARDVMIVEGRLAISVGPGPAADDGSTRVRLSVSDTGPGIPPEVRNRLFQPFFTTKARGRGTGLGLATSRSIARSFGGELSFETTLGKGTVFHLDLPEIADPLATSYAEDDVASATPRMARILLVEDDELVRAVAVALIESLGHRVFAYGDSLFALEWAERGGLDDIDILLTDIVMPGIGGHELAARLRALRPGLPVVYMSGYVDDPSIAAAMSNPDVVFLAKPFTNDELSTRLDQAIAMLP